MRITEDTFKRFRRNEINFVKCLKELLHIAWYDNNKTLNTNDEKNFEISFRNKNEFDYALDRTISNLERIGAKRIKSNRALGRITFLMPDSAKVNITNMFTAKEDEREKAYKDSIESADISKYYPSEDVLNKIRGYRDRGSRINVKAMNNLDKILTYYYACILLDWERVAGELSDQAMDVAIHKEDVKNILNAIYEKTEAQETDERDALAKKENLPKNDLIQFSDKIRRQQGTWLPKSILKFFIDNNIPVRLDGRSYGGDFDRNGVQWSERENFTVYPGTDHEIKDSIVVNTLESGGPTKYSYSGAGIRVGVQKVLNALAYRYLREGVNESVKSDKLIDTEYSHTKDTAKDKEYFKNKYEKKGYKNVCVKKVKSDTKGLPMYEIYGDKEVNESLNESNDEDMGYKLGKWLGARLLTGWTAMLNVDGAEESPYYDEYDQQFDGNFVQCLNKLKEYQDIIDRDGVDAYLALQSSHDEYFDGDYDTIIDKLYDRGYLYDDDIDESINEDTVNRVSESYSHEEQYRGCKILSDFNGEGPYTVVCLHKEYEFPTREEAMKKIDELLDDNKKNESLNEFYDKGWQETGRGWSSDTYKIAEKVYEFLKDNDIWVDIYDYDPDSGEFSLEIDGDWKHEHLRAEWLIEENLKEIDGFRIEKMGSYPLEDSNDDSYRGVHQYRIVNIEEENNRRKEMQERRKKFEDSLVKKVVNGKEVYVSPDGKMFTKGYFSDSPDETMWFEVNESLNENCNSYSYKGKTIIDAGDYWFVKGYKEKFPTSDEAEEFIDDKKKDEGVNINIRESLNKMDAESDNTYDLLNLYESKNLSKSQKKDIARMIYENYGLEKIYKYLYEATEEEDELPVEDRIKELTNNFKNTNGSYVFEEVQDANKAIAILKSRGYEASQKRTQDNKYRVTAEKKNNNK